MEPTLADIEEGVRALEKFTQAAAVARQRSQVGQRRVDEFIRGSKCGSTARWTVSLARTSAGPNDG